MRTQGDVLNLRTISTLYKRNNLRTVAKMSEIKIVF